MGLLQSCFKCKQLTSKFKLLILGCERNEELGSFPNVGQILV